MIYVKSAMPPDAPIDIRQYQDAHPDFPHESTADQWFDEDQFEAYRHLGQIVAEDICQGLFVRVTDRELPSGKWADSLWQLLADDYAALEGAAEKP